jgi:hypothetical protein
MVIRNKRASGEELMMPEIVLLLATLMIFGAMLVFVAKAGSSALFYEEVYAKEIALLVENSVPGQTYEIDVTNAMEIAKKGKINLEVFSHGFLVYNETDNSVNVKIGSSGGYKFVYFSKINLTNKYYVSVTKDKAKLVLNL